MSRSNPTTPSDSSTSLPQRPTGFRGESLKSDRVPVARVAAYDMSLQELTSDSLAMSPRRPLRRSESSLGYGSPRETSGPTAPCHNAHESISNVMSRGPPMHRRTGSTLKTVMRKIFSRKRRSETDDLDDSPLDPSSNHVRERSPDMGAGQRHFYTVHESSGPDGISPLPNVDAHRVPRRHSPNSVGRSLETVSDFLEQLPPRRRATLPSLIFPDDDARSDLAVNGDGGSSPEFGNTQDELRRIRQAKRRSRSAGALRAAAKAHRMSPIQWRRASAEISSWKGTALETDSVGRRSFNRPPTRTTVATDPKEESVAELAASISDAVPETEPESAPYDLGHLVNSMQHDDSVTLEQRMTTLEVKLIDLEFAIARMQTQSESAAADKSRQKQTPTPDVARQHSYPPAHSQNPVSGEGRPRSTSTIRPTTLHRSHTLQTPSTNSLSDFGGISVEQYSALVMLLRREQTARRNLENQVTALQEDMRRLQRMALGSTGSVTTYPVRSSDSQELLHFRRALDVSRSVSPTRTEERVGGFDSDSDVERSDLQSDDVFGRPKWDRNQQVEMAGMI